VPPGQHFKLHFMNTITPKSLTKAMLSCKINNLTSQWKIPGLYNQRHMGKGGDLKLSKKCGTIQIMRIFRKILSYNCFKAYIRFEWRAIIKTFLLLKASKQCFKKQKKCSSDNFSNNNRFFLTIISKWSLKGITLEFKKEQKKRFINLKKIYKSSFSFGWEPKAQSKF